MSSELEQFTMELGDKLIRIEKLPDLIAEAQKATNHKEDIDTVKTQIKMMSLSFEKEAGLIVDENKKPKYSNAKLREGFVKEKMESEPDAIALKNQLSEYEAKKINAGIELDKLRNELSALKIIIPVLRETMRHSNIVMAANNKKVTVEVHHVAG
jgi:hypothetical protein